MTQVRRTVLDVLKPHEPNMREYASEISEVKGVKSVNSALVENDEDVENIKLTILGKNFEFSSVKDTIEELGGSLHSVDEIVCGDKIVEQVETPQD